MRGRQDHWIGTQNIGVFLHVTKDSTARTVLLALALAGVTFVVFGQTAGHEFLHYDDPDYVTENPHVLPGLTLANVKWAFTTGHAANWHPVTWLSHMLDCALFGPNPRGPHLVNVLLHAVNAVLLFLVLRTMTQAVWRSLLVAALFALHPLHVESVAWIAERKDVLSTLFWLLTMWAYVAYTRRRSVARYVVVAALLALGLMAKPMLVTLPFVLLLLDYWPLKRFPAEKGARVSLRVIRPFVVEKIPLFALSVASCLVTVLVQHQGGAVATLSKIALPYRIGNAAEAYAEYLLKTLWPAKLAAFYPHPGASLAWGVAILSAFVLAAVSVLALRTLKSRRYVAVGWLWYVGTLIPVIGLVQVGDQAMADRYTYVPLIGVFIVIAWALGEAVAAKPGWRAVIVAYVVLTMGVLGALTWVQTSRWRNDTALFSHALAVTEYNAVAHNNLGNALLRDGLRDQAIRHFRDALEIDPGHIRAYVNLGQALYELGNIQEAVQLYARALQLAPNHAPAHVSLGVALLKAGHPEEAAQHLARAVQLDPENVEAHNNLGVALAAQGRLKEAAQHFAEALRLRPDHSGARQNLERALAQLKQNGALEQ